MRIAQVAPLYESVPPQLYGGTERVVSYLTEELVALGHDVTLFASTDSQTAARLVAPCGPALRLGSEWADPHVPHVLMHEQVDARADQFDIIHMHTDYVHYPFARRARCPTLVTVHSRLDIPDVAPLLREFSDLPFVSISGSQREPIPDASWAATVHHGVPAHLYQFEPRPGDYLAFIGRISPEKQPDAAIEIAMAAGMEVRIAAKVDRADRVYFEERIKPYLGRPGVTFIGEVNDRSKSKFLGGARALLFPIDWPEPFGLVMIEAMACGTPVIAYRRGSVPEILEEGLTGYIVENASQAVAAVEKARHFDRGACRRRFEERFTSLRMATDYVAVYQRQLARRGTPLQRGAR